MNTVQQLDAWSHQPGAIGYLVLATAALIEHVFPPFPGDTVVVLGGAWAERDHHSLPLVLLSVTLGSAVGLSLNYLAGRAVAARLAVWPDERRLLGVEVRRLRAAQASMRRRGPWLLVINRFLPSFRAVLYLAAGASQLRFRTVLVLGTVSALLWNSLLLGVGAAVGANAERIDALATSYQRVAFGAVALVVAGLAVRWWLKRGPTVVGAA